MLNDLLAQAQQARQRGDHADALRCFNEAAAIDPANIWARMEAAVELIALGRAPDAEEAYRAVLDQVPGQPVALLGLATCARAAGDHARALALHRQILDADPDHLWARVQAAKDLERLHRIDEAEAELMRVVGQDPAHQGGLLGLGQCARLRGDRLAALGWHQRAAAAHPDNDWIALAVVADLCALDRLEEAQSILTALLDRAPSDAWALVHLADLHRRAGRRAEAGACLVRAVAADPDHIHARLELAGEDRALGRFEAARAGARAALERAPASVAAWLNLGETERAAGRHAEARDAFGRAVALEPRRADALLQMAVEERALGHAAACEALLAQAQAIEPTNPAILLQQVESARSAQDGARMHALLEDAAVRWPAHAGLQMAYADCLALLGQPEAALAHLEAFGERAEHAAAARIRRVAMLRRHGFWPEAAALAREVTAARPQDLTGWMERLACETLVGSDADIEACLAQAPAITPRERAWRARLHGRVLEDQGDWEAAAARYDESAMLDPSAAETAFMRTRLALVMLDLPAARHALRAYVRLSAATARLRGHSAQASQTHYGQLLDEYLLDSEVVAALQPLRTLPAEMQVEPILQLAAANPDSTAAAVSLVQALHACQSGGTAAPHPANPHIPPVIVQFWDTPEIPADVAAIMDSWQRHHPGHERRLFNDATAREFIARTHGAAAARLYGTLRVPAQKADVFRLAYLAVHGGIYVDADDRCHAPLATIVPAHARLVLYQEDLGTLGNNFIAAAPRHPVLSCAFALAMFSIARGDQDTVWLSTGPALLTRAFARSLAAMPESGGMRPWRTWCDSVTILHNRTLFRSVAIHSGAAYKSTFLHWGNAAFTVAKSSAGRVTDGK